MTNGLPLMQENFILKTAFRLRISRSIIGRCTKIGTPSESLYTMNNYQMVKSSYGGRAFIS